MAECCSEEEQNALEVLLCLGFVDLYRRAHPCATEEPGWTRTYSERDPTKGDARIHLILASKSSAQGIPGRLHPKLRCRAVSAGVRVACRAGAGSRRVQLSQSVLGVLR